ncbi:MAG TPA: ComEC/Rec2 family competence protein [Beijerinckiaceae bacterium]|jgi:competence protein ComEC
MTGSRRGKEGAAAALAGYPLASGLTWRLSDWREPLARWLALEVEHRRLFPWLAVAFGAGVLLFFAAEGRPRLWAPLTGAALAAGLAIALRANPVGRAVGLGTAALFGGFAAGVVRLDTVHTPVLGEVVVGPLSGFVEVLEERNEGARILVRVTAVAGLTPDALPRRVRVTAKDAAGLRPGQHFTATARLLPLPEAVRPGGYDFGRDAYFQGIGAVGSLLRRPEIKPAPRAPDFGLRINAAVDEARNTLTRRIADAIGGPAGAVTAALVTGKRGLIDQDTNEVLRGAGIYHIVSISGLHMVLAAGAFFWAARALLALWPHAALFWPIKKIAAVIAMAGASAYCVFAGAEVATERSLIMILVMLGAVLVDRPAISLRNLALAAILVLAREPETLLGPSFQMSFGAVAALTALTGWLPRRENGPPPQDMLGRALNWLVTAALVMLVTTLVASVATAPFAAYHFQTANPLGLIGNALALPLVSLIVMPGAVLGVIALPFGLDRLVWEFTGFGVATVLKVADWVSDLSGATLLVPAFCIGALLLFAAALLLATLPISPLRHLALVPALGGLALASQPSRPDLLVDRSGAGAALRGADGRYVLVGRVSTFVAGQWLKADGDSREPDDPSLRSGARCDPVGCIATGPNGRVLAVILDRRAVEEDCARAQIVVTPLTLAGPCTAKTVLDRSALARSGAVAITFESEAIKSEQVRRRDEDRPWLLRPARAQPQAAPAAPTRPTSRRAPINPDAAPEDADDDQ